MISRQSFANLLKELESKGIVIRKVVNSSPPRVDYSLTEKGRRITVILGELDSIS